ncbi:MAG: hypothetical protein SGPRY_011764 [Prymnesium sp.]
MLAPVLVSMHVNQRGAFVVNVQILSSLYSINVTLIGATQENEFMIIEKSPLVNTYISSAPCNCAAFTAGIVRGVLEGAHFPAEVSAHDYEDSRTAILIKFAPEVVEREKRIT